MPAVQGGKYPICWSCRFTILKVCCWIFTLQGRISNVVVFWHHVTPLTAVKESVRVVVQNLASYLGTWVMITEAWLLTRRVHPQEMIREMDTHTVNRPVSLIITYVPSNWLPNYNSSHTHTRLWYSPPQSRTLDTGLACTRSVSLNQRVSQSATHGQWKSCVCCGSSVIRSTALSSAC